MRSAGSRRRRPGSRTERHIISLFEFLMRSAMLSRLLHKSLQHQPIPAPGLLPVAYAAIPRVLVAVAEAEAAEAAVSLRQRRQPAPSFLAGRIRRRPLRS